MRVRGNIRTSGTSGCVEPHTHTQAESKGRIFPGKRKGYLLIFTVFHAVTEHHCVCQKASGKALESLLQVLDQVSQGLDPDRQSDQSLVYAQLCQRVRSVSSCRGVEREVGE